MAQIKEVTYIEPLDLKEVLTGKRERPYACAS